jgi:predicted acylesterase/phospholipase RssA
MVSSEENKPKRQRALVLQGGGALGAYEIGVLKVLSKKLKAEDMEKGEENRLLFDIVAGTSIGAMNGAVLVSQFLQTGSWEDAIEKLELFWTDKEEGLASTLSEQDINKLPGRTEWQKASKEDSQGVASAEAARRYYSVKYFISNGAPKVHEPLQPRPDSKFFDEQGNTWFLIHSNDPLKQTILKFAKFPIATSFKNAQPRLLIFSVDVAEGETVTFDSYPKADGSRKSEYGKHMNEKDHVNVIKYNDGITIDYVMASGTIPVFYDYQEIDGRKFWDGGLLSNTPFRELLQAYQDDWTDALTEENKDNIPDLEVYIVNVHPSKQPNPHTDLDRVRDRQNDIIFSDRTSYNDEKVADLVTDYKYFTAQIKDLATEAISKVNDETEKENLKEKFEMILATTAISKDHRGKSRNYEDLMKGRFKLTKVIRIENTNYTNSISGKDGDFTAQTIEELIKEGEKDATNTLSNII